MSNAPRLFRTREARGLLVAYALAAAICAFLPLADHLGFEFAALLTIVSAITAPFVGFAAMQAEKSLAAELRRPARAAARAGLFAAAALVVPAVLILLNALRRPICDPVAGSLWLLVLAAPTAWLAATFGALARLLTSRLRWAVAIVLGVEMASLAASVAAVYYGPPVFGFDHFFGYFPGPIYDETILVSSALLSFRVATVLCGVTAAAAAGALASGDRTARRMHTWWAGALASLLIAISIAWGAELGWRTTDRSLRAALSGEIRIDNLVLHFPRDWSDREVEALLRNATFEAAQVERVLGIAPAHPVHVWMYGSASEKRRLTGAYGVVYAKPWRHELHINPGAYPHRSLRHELVHAMAGEFSKGPWLTPGGLVPNSALVEGFAVAYDLDDGTLTPTQEAKAMRELNIAPNLVRLLEPGGFVTEASTRAYTYAGAFIRYLDSQFGVAAMRTLYLSGDLSALGPPDALIRDFEKMLDTVKTDANARSSSARRNAQPSIFRRRCARAVIAMVDSAFTLAGNRLGDQALARFDEACALQPSDPSLVRDKLGVAIRMNPNSHPRIMETADALWSHPNLDPSLEGSSRVLVGDELWRQGDFAGARVQYARASALPLDPETRREVRIRVRATADPALAPIIMPYYTEAGGVFGKLLGMVDAVTRRPNDALLLYLVGHQLSIWGADDKGAELMDRANAVGLGDVELARHNLTNLVAARARRNRCDQAERAHVSLRAAAGSATEDAVATDWVARCRFAIARGWRPLP